MRPPTWPVAAPYNRDRTAARQRKMEAARKVQSNVISQCDGCGATDDAEHRLGMERHEGCTGRFRLYGTAP